MEIHVPFFYAIAALTSTEYCFSGRVIHTYDLQMVQNTEYPVLSLIRFHYQECDFFHGTLDRDILLLLNL